MVMTFILTPQAHYNTITESRAHFLYFLLEGLSIEFPFSMILSTLDTFRDIASHDKLIFPFFYHAHSHACTCFYSFFYSLSCYG